jgi:endo-1,4-beta-xylanase
MTKILALKMASKVAIFGARFTVTWRCGIVAGSFDAPSDVKKDIAERGPHDFAPGQGNNTLNRRSAIDYDQDYTTGGTVNYSPSSTGFSVSWDTEDGFDVGVGWVTGTPGNH